MKILKANIKHKKIVLNLLIEFKRYCYKIYKTNDKSLSEENYLKNISVFFDKQIDRDDSVIFLAKIEEDYVGIITTHKIPQFRNGGFVAEIEEFFIIEKFWGKSVAEKLMRRVEDWCKEKDIKQLRLESGKLLTRGHNFYKKYGFKNYGHAFIKFYD